MRAQSQQEQQEQEPEQPLRHSEYLHEPDANAGVDHIKPESKLNLKPLSVINETCVTSEYLVYFLFFWLVSIRLD